MAVLTCTLRCDRCGKRETFLDAETTPIPWGVAAVQVQGPNLQPRQYQANICPDCLMAPSIFNPKPELARAVEADIAAINGRRE
jgi:hypothetical protein